MTTCNIPATGAKTSQWFIEEVTCGVTPTSPAWSPLRFTSGNPQLTKDGLQSAELDGSRDVADLRLGSNQTTGEISMELSMTFYDALLAAALGDTFSTGASDAGVAITVDDVAKTFTRAAGDFVADGVVVGDIIQFKDLALGNNAGVFFVTTVTTTLVTCANAVDLAAEADTSDYKVGDRLVIGDTRTTFSILTHFEDADSGAGEYHITRGVEISAFAFDVSVNAMVTGTLSTIGRTYSPDVPLPSGSTFLAPTKTEPFASVDGRIIENDVTLAFTTSISMTMDNAASAQFEIGSNDTSFIERGRANSTLSLSTFFEDSTLLTKFINETETSVVVILEGTDGAMAFIYPRVIYTSGAPDVAGEGSITQSLDAQALAGTAQESSIQIHRLTP